MQRLESWFLMVFFLAFITICGVATLAQLRPVLPAQSRELLAGTWTFELGKQVDESLAMRDFAVSFWAAVEYLIFTEGKPGVVVGRDDWLYSSEELVAPQHAEKSALENGDFILAVERYLSLRHVELLVVLVPAKADVYTEFLTERPSALLSSSVQKLEAYLAPSVDLLSLRGPFDAQKNVQPLFLKTDTHWTPQGAALAARTIAERVQQEGLVFDKQVFRTYAVNSEVLEGDLMNFLPLKPYFSGLAPDADQITVYQTDSESSGDLFAETTADIVLVGTSYSANPLWNFEGALKEALAADLINHAREGQGPFLPMLEYLKSDDFKNHPPKLVIWEMPVRYIPVAYELAPANQWMREQSLSLVGSDD